MKNLPTLTKDRGEKPEKIKQEKGLRLFYSLGGGGDGLSRSTTFFY